MLVFLTPCHRLLRPILLLTFLPPDSLKPRRRSSRSDRSSVGSSMGHQRPCDTRDPVGERDDHQHPWQTGHPGSRPSTAFGAQQPLPNQTCVQHARSTPSDAPPRDQRRNNEDGKKWWQAGRSRVGKAPEGKAAHIDPSVTRVRRAAMARLRRRSARQIGSLLSGKSPLPSRTRSEYNS